MKPLIKTAPSFEIAIFMGGSYSKAIKTLQEYCNTNGFCVTVSATLYVFTGGNEHGIKVGLINYPRFSSDSRTLIQRAIEIAEILRIELKQETFSIQTPHDTIWYSYRKEDASEN